MSCDGSFSGAGRGSDDDDLVFGRHVQRWGEILKWILYKLIRVEGRKPQNVRRKKIKNQRSSICESREFIERRARTAEMPAYS